MDQDMEVPLPPPEDPQEVPDGHTQQDERAAAIKASIGAFEGLLPPVEDGADEVTTPPVPATHIAADPVFAQQQVKRLPACPHMSRVLAKISEHPVTCIRGDTGSGKSSLVPIALLKANEALHRHDGRRRLIIVTQPRRLAATQLSSRIADLLAHDDKYSPRRDQVGYRLGGGPSAHRNPHFSGFARPNEDTSRVLYDSAILFVTTGYLLSSLLHDNDRGLLSHASHVILDEVHERSLDGDMLALVLRLRMGQSDSCAFKLILMSATIQSDIFCNYFAKGPNGEALGAAAVATTPPRSDDAIEADADAIEADVDAAPPGIDPTLAAHSRDEVVAGVPSLYIGGRPHPVRVLFIEEIARGANGEGESDSTEEDSDSSDDSDASHPSEAKAPPLVPPAIAVPLKAYYKELRALMARGNNGNAPTQRPERVHDSIGNEMFLESVAKMAIASCIRGAAVMVFLPGIREIEEVRGAVEEHFKKAGLPFGNAGEGDLGSDSDEEDGTDTGNARQPTEVLIFTLHSNAEKRHQDRAMRRCRPNQFKLVLSTTIGETSITIPDLRIVIDTGITRKADYDERRRMSVRSTVWCSKSSAKQRAGRAGRVSGGLVIRLFTRNMFENYFPEQNEPELKPMEKATLQVLAQLTPRFGTIHSVMAQLMEPPTPADVDMALARLVALGAIQAPSHPTGAPYTVHAVGRLALTLPFDIDFAPGVLAGAFRGCAAEMIVFCCGMSMAQSLFKRPLSVLYTHMSGFLAEVCRLVRTVRHFEGPQTAASQHHHPTSDVFPLLLRVYETFAHLKGPGARRELVQKNKWSLHLTALETFLGFCAVAADNLLEFCRGSAANLCAEDRARLLLMASYTHGYAQRAALSGHYSHLYDAAGSTRPVIIRFPVDSARAIEAVDAALSAIAIGASVVSIKSSRIPRIAASSARGSGSAGDATDLGPWCRSIALLRNADRYVNPLEQMRELAKMVDPDTASSPHEVEIIPADCKETCVAFTTKGSARDLAAALGRVGGDNEEGGPAGGEGPPSVGGTIAFLQTLHSHPMVRLLFLLPFLSSWKRPYLRGFPGRIPTAEVFGLPAYSPVFPLERLRTGPDRFSLCSLPVTLPHPGRVFSEPLQVATATALFALLEEVFLLNPPPAPPTSNGTALSEKTLAQYAKTFAGGAFNVLLHLGAFQSVSRAGNRSIVVSSGHILTGAACNSMQESTGLFRSELATAKRVAVLLASSATTEYLWEMLLRLLPAIENDDSDAARDSDVAREAASDMPCPKGVFILTNGTIAAALAFSSSEPRNPAALDAPAAPTTIVDDNGDNANDTVGNETAVVTPAPSAPPSVTNLFSLAGPDARAPVPLAPMLALIGLEQLCNALSQHPDKAATLRDAIDALRKEVEAALGAGAKSNNNDLGDGEGPVWRWIPLPARLVTLRGGEPRSHALLFDVESALLAAAATTAAPPLLEAYRRVLDAVAETATLPTEDERVGALLSHRRRLHGLHGAVRHPTVSESTQPPPPPQTTARKQPPKQPQAQKQPPKQAPAQKQPPKQAPAQKQPPKQAPAQKQPPAPNTMPPHVLTILPAAIREASVALLARQPFSKSRLLDELATVYSVKTSAHISRHRHPNALRSLCGEVFGAALKAHYIVRHTQGYVFGNAL